ncbi:MAG TPA: TetR/AcrR family transcriptional regulator [Solirubrobacterales bacterium]|jgi:AcrR family transcriptional regulator|nr:TetR/AcrR family transcriptional regulator [Solirubrobacterales bacterium]
MNNVNRDVKSRGRNPRGEGERLRATLLDAATELIAESENPENVSIRGVTRRAGVSPTALYLHFESREELFVAVSEACFAELGDVMCAAGEGAGDDPREQLVAMGHAYLRFARERPGHYAVLFQRHLTPEPEEDEPKIGMEVFDSLVEVVRRCGVAEDEAFDSGVLLWMALHGRASVTSAMPAFPFPDEDRYVRLLAERVIG